MTTNQKIRVFLDNTSDISKTLVPSRIIVNLEKSFQSVGIEIVHDIEEEFDIAYFLSASSVVSHESELIKKKKPVVLQAFSDIYDSEIKSGNLPALRKDAERIYNLVDMILVGFNAQKIILRHYNISSPIEVVPTVTEYTLDKEDKYNKNAFRSAYGVAKDVPIVINYGVYDTDNGFEEYEALARIMPDIEFFFFGAKNGLFNSSEYYARNLNLKNMHYEGVLPLELYDSAMVTVSAIVITGKYHVENIILAEAMRAGVPIISAKNGVLFDLLISGKTAYICDTIDDYYYAIKNINEDYVKSAYEYVSNSTYFEKGSRLRSIFLDLINNQK